MRAVLQRVIGSVFTVTGAQDADTERRSSLLLWTAAILEVLLAVAAVTLGLGPGTMHVWLATVPIGIPILLVCFLLARRARADAAALLFTAVVVWLLAMFAWIEGPGCNRMTVAIAGIVAMGAVLSTRICALIGLGLAGMIAGLAAAESAGLYRPIEHAAAAEAAHAPFVRQTVFVALVVVLLRRGYDRLVGQVRDREHARTEAVAAARAIHASLEVRVAERTSSLAAARDRLSALAERLATDLGADLRAMRQRLDDFAAGEPALDGEARRGVARASAAIERLSVMTDRLHDFAQVGATALRPEPIAMAALAREVIEEFGRAARDAEAEAEAEIEWRVDPLPSAWADPAVVRAVIENLVSNAIKFTRQRRPPRIHVGHDADRGYFVRDNGVGFDPRRAGELFLPFHRLHAADQFEGHGVGLANVRRMVERSGGDVSVDGALDRGAAFYFRLPHQREDA